MTDAKQKYYILIPILLVALILRLWGINHQIYTDENKVVTPSVLLAQGKQIPLLYPKGSYYPHLYHYVLGVGFLPSALLHAPYPSTDTSVDTYTLIARIITAIMGTATVYVVFRIGTELRDSRLGLISSAFLAVLPLHIKYSHYAHVDIPLTLTVAITLWSALQIIKTNNIKWYIITGVLTGMSGAIHYTGFVIGITLIIVHAILILQKKQYSLKTICSRALILGLIAIPISFALCTPYTIIKWSESVRIYTQLSLRGTAGDLGYTRPNFIWPITTTSPDWGLPFTVSGIFWEFNPAIILLAILGFLIILCKRQWNIFVLVGGTIIIMYIAIIGRLPLYAIKRLLPLAPFIVIFAGLAIVEVWNLQKMQIILRHFIVSTVITGVLLYASVLAIGFDVAYMNGSTHSMAVLWAKNHLPHGSFILQHAPIRLIDWSDPNFNTERINEVYANFNADDPEVSHDRAKPISDWIAKKRIQYVAMDSRIVDRYFDPTSVKLFPETTASYQDFYTKIRTRGKLVYQINPKLWHIAGPRIEIYDIQNIQ